VYRNETTIPRPSFVKTGLVGDLANRLLTEEHLEHLVSLSLVEWKNDFVPQGFENTIVIHGSAAISKFGQRFIRVCIPPEFSLGCGSAEVR
jgi:hypothetical protein